MPTLLFVFFLFKPQPRLRYSVSHIICWFLRRCICEDKTSFLISSNCLSKPEIKHYEPHFSYLVIKDTINFLLNIKFSYEQKFL